MIAILSKELGVFWLINLVFWFFYFLLKKICILAFKVEHFCHTTGFQAEDVQCFWSLSWKHD